MHRTADGQTPLHYAALSEHEQVSYFAHLNPFPEKINTIGDISWWC